MVILFKAVAMLVGFFTMGVCFVYIVSIIVSEIRSKRPTEEYMDRKPLGPLLVTHSKVGGGILMGFYIEPAYDTIIPISWLWEYDDGSTKYEWDVELDELPEFKSKSEMIDILSNTASINKQHASIKDYLGSPEWQIIKKELM